LRASRDSSRQAEATGINTKRIQWVAFTLAGTLAGLSGALFVFSKGSVFPTELEIARSFDALVLAADTGNYHYSGSNHRTARYQRNTAQSG